MDSQEHDHEDLEKRLSENLQKGLLEVLNERFLDVLQKRLSKETADVLERNKSSITANSFFRTGGLTVSDCLIVRIGDGDSCLGNNHNSIKISNDLFPDHRCADLEYDVYEGDIKEKEGVEEEKENTSERPEHEAVIQESCIRKIKNDPVDVLLIISNTYDTVLSLKNEKERQARKSFNAALGLIIAGVTIVFGSVFLFIRNNIIGGILSSVVGAISSIIGGTIMKLYKDTNDRLDKYDDDLFTLYTAQVQYALIREIDDVKKRNAELIKLIESIGNIKSKKQTALVA